MNRITAEQVKAAIEQTGARLVRDKTWSRDEFYGKPRYCGCPIGIIAASQCDQKPDKLDLADSAHVAGLDSDYALGFAVGFDGPDAADQAWLADRRLRGPDDVAWIGYQDGIDIAVRLYSFIWE